MAPNSANASTKTFGDLHGEFCKEDVYVRLLHSWEARDFKKIDILMGVEVLLLDFKKINIYLQVTMQGFISANRLYRFQSRLKAGTIYKLCNFVIHPAKRVYRVSSHELSVIFTDQTSFVEEGSTIAMATHKFRIQNFQAFVDIADTATELYDIIGHISIIDGENLQGHTPLSTPPAAGGRSNEMVFFHVQLEEYAR